MKDLKPKRYTVSQCVNCITEDGYIADELRDHFNGILNSVNDEADWFSFDEALNREHDDDVYMWELRSVAKRFKTVNMY